MCVAEDWPSQNFTAFYSHHALERELFIKTPNMSGVLNNTGRFHPVDRKHRIPRIEAEAVEQIEGLLAKWGITPNTKATHASFESHVKEVVAKCLNATILQKWKPFDTSVVLPSDTIESLKILLEHNLRQVTKDGTEHTKTETTDVIKDRYGVLLLFPPFNFVRGGRLVLSHPYKELRLSSVELDPLSRFAYKQRPMKGYMLEQFNEAPNEEYPSHLVRALALHEAVNGGNPCLSCGKAGCLRWNSALRSDFCNIICDECNSFYSLCSVSGSKKVNKVFKNKSHFRGSYAHFQHLQSLMNETSHRGQMFLLFATRSASSVDNKLPVYAAQIKGAQPNLTSDSFSPDRIRIKSNVIFEPLLDKVAWFSVDVPNDLDIVGFSMEVFHAHFDEEVEDESTVEPTESNGSFSARKNEQQIVSLKKVLAQIQSIQGKQERGIELQAWELDLLGREMKVVKKLNQLEGANE